MKEILHNLIYEPWPWWIGGPLIGIFVIVLLLIEGKQLGISSSYHYICSKLSPLELDYFKNPEKSAWQFWFVIGLIIGAVIIQFTVPSYHIDISSESIKTLSAVGIDEQIGYVPVELYQFSTKGIGILAIGGLLIGFGARYANGCTAGHAIMGCAQASPASLIATICFFIGGLIATHFIVPFLF